MSRRALHASGIVLLWLAGLAGITTLSVLADQNLDLPVHPATHATEPPSPPPEDDPRDEPPPTFYGEEIDTESDSIFYVIDFSCSMGREDRDLRAKAEFTRSVAGLAPSMRFNVLVYTCQLTLWAPGMQRADDGNKASAIAFVNSRFPSSGTATGPGVAMALRTDPSNMAVVLLTDGAPNCGAPGVEYHRSMISSNNLQGATINVFGIDARGTYRAFLTSVAGDSGGAYFDVP